MPRSPALGSGRAISSRLMEDGDSDLHTALLCLASMGCMGFSSYLPFTLIYSDLPSSAWLNCLFWHIKMVQGTMYSSIRSLGVYRFINWILIHWTCADSSTNSYGKEGTREPGRQKIWNSPGIEKNTWRMSGSFRGEKAQSRERLPVLIRFIEQRGIKEIFTVLEWLAGTGPPKKSLFIQLQCWLC